MSRRSFRAGLLAAFVALAAAPRAYADASGEQSAAAQALYDESGLLMTAGRWAEACPKLETSQRLDPAIGTLIRLAYCYCEGSPSQAKGKTASAWAAFTDAESLARKANDKRAEDAAKQARLLEPRLSRLLLELDPERQAGLEIRRDGKVVDPGLWGTAVPVDPGSHTLEASKPGKQPWKTTFEIESKPGLTKLRVPVLPDVPAEPAESKEEPAAKTWGAQRIAGVAVGSAGLVVVALGGVLGGVAIGKNNASKAAPYCLPSAPSLCTADGAALRRRAGTLADASTHCVIRAMTPGLLLEVDDFGLKILGGAASLHLGNGSHSKVSAVS